MADDLGAVRRTLRPTGDRQTPETVAQPGAGTTQDVPEGKETNPPLSTRERLAELIAATDRHMTPEDFAEPRLAARAHATAILAAGWRAPRPDHEAALADLRTKLAEEPDSILFAGPECDMEAYAALPPCAACEGCGQDTHGTVFEAPLAVHFAGPPVRAERRHRQLCMRCGHVLVDITRGVDERFLDVDSGDWPIWPVGALVRVENGLATRVPHADGAELPPGCCALPDDEPPTPEPGCYPPADGWDGVSTADVPVDPDDGYPVDLCGKRTGNCSNRCLLPAHHAGECDDDPHPGEAPGCCTACNGTGTVETGYPCEDCYATGHSHAETVSCDGVQAADGPDEAQETRAADWPAEETR